MTGQDFKLRLASLDDLNRMVEVEEEAFAYPWTRRMIAQEFEHPWSSQWVACAQDRVIAGQLIVWNVADELHILNLAVALAFRRQGVARKLLEQSFAQAAELGGRICTLELRRTNPAALALYEGMDFRVVGERPRYYAGDGEDALLMERTL